MSSKKQADPRREDSIPEDEQPGCLTVSRPNTCLHEATIYGFLVHYLRDTWAAEASTLRGTTVQAERDRLDGLIRTWFFSPQQVLSGFTPRQMIRNEEQGLPTLLTDDHPSGPFLDDCPVCEEMRAMGGEWEYGLSPDQTLLDEYDPEGEEAKWADLMPDRSNPGE